MELPEKTTKIEYIDLPEDERQFYDRLYSQSKNQFDKYINEGSLISNYAHVFELLLRLRYEDAGYRKTLSCGMQAW